MLLRPYQQSGVDGVNAAWANGAKNVLYVLPCRGGKTPVASHLILNNKGGSCAIAHRGFLLTQMSMTLARNGVRHRIIGAKETIQACVSQHMAIFGKHYVDPNASCAVASVDTLALMDVNEPFFSTVTLWFTDEAHHLLKDNKWGKAVGKFKNARGVGVTATPMRADGNGLGAHADGLMHEIVVGPSLRDLIDAGHVCDYRIFAPPSDLNLSEVKVGASGDFSPEPLRKVIHDSPKLVGDIVQHYLKYAAGEIGMTFAVDVESATEIAAAYRSAGVPAECVTAKTPATLRFHIEQRHQRGEVKQLVNVDLYGEGADIKNLGVVTFGRPTASYPLFEQQFCRPLNMCDGKKFGIIIDAVGNIRTQTGGRHPLPDTPRIYTLDRREKRSKGVSDAIPLRACTNCFSVYERYAKACPFCGFIPEIVQRNRIELVDGDLFELDADTLAAMRAKVDPPVSTHPDRIIQATLLKRHREKHEAQVLLREAMAAWAGGISQCDDAETVGMLQRRWYLTFGVDTMTAQSLGAREALELLERVGVK